MLLGALALLVAPPIAAAASAQGVPPTQPNAPAQNGADQRPTVSFTISGVVSADTEGTGALWRRIREAIAAANAGDGSGLSTYLAPNADLTLRAFGADPQAGSVRTAFTAATIRAVTQSCIGPYVYREGSNWVQFSWICRVSRPTPLSPLLTFRFSPELNATVFFEGDRIQAIAAGEHIPTPGGQLVTMDAVEQIESRRR
jgi:hypothetical protein